MSGTPITDALENTGSIDLYARFESMREHAENLERKLAACGARLIAVQAELNTANRRKHETETLLYKLLTASDNMGELHDDNMCDDEINAARELLTRKASNE